jgi:hypothetical protein
MHIHPATFFVRLGRRDLQLLSSMLGIEELVQKPGNSLVFHTERKKFYKIIMDSDYQSIHTLPWASIPLYTHSETHTERQHKAPYTGGYSLSHPPANNTGNPEAGQERVATTPA